MSLMKTVVFTTLDMSLPAALRSSVRFFENLMSLSLDTLGDDAGGRINADLTGCIYHASDDLRLGIGADCGRSLVCGNGFHICSSLIVQADFEALVAEGAEQPFAVLLAADFAGNVNVGLVRRKPCAEPVVLNGEYICAPARQCRLRA